MVADWSDWSKNYNLERWSSYDFASRSNHWNNKEHKIIYFMVRFIPVWREGNGFISGKRVVLKLNSTRVILKLNSRSSKTQLRNNWPYLETNRFHFNLFFRTSTDQLFSAQNWVQTRLKKNPLNSFSNGWINESL